jgi:hypothetical protein
LSEIEKHPELEAEEEKVNKMGKSRLDREIRVEKCGRC